ncbi:D-ribose pyranase [Roseospira visakhapatnamensis]|uniref:D-ribose pyranase n=1 Tax=Roseospira visakhapatnamensis TaxID=390880 RepID=A0A7W6RCR5_9PROT|nr:D-ribose pyranase [Roseospira visakhapatnamensis]MBB4266139.1 D-ribose pyranase [Roseospira visakhapatnamensis]
MKKTALLNAPVSAAVARMGHTDGLVVCDAGLPIPAGPERIDLALVAGVPSFLEVVAAIGAELRIERALIATDLPARNPRVHAALQALLDEIGTAQGAPISIDQDPHARFKARTREARAVVRTGECSPFANVILYAGVVF